MLILCAYFVSVFPSIYFITVSSKAYFIEAVTEPNIEKDGLENEELLPITTILSPTLTVILLSLLKKLAAIKIVSSVDITLVKLVAAVLVAAWQRVRQLHAHVVTQKVYQSLILHWCREWRGFDRRQRIRQLHAHVVT